MESFSSSSGNPSPQPSPENLRKQKQTPFLSKLIEKKKSRTLETEENDYTENPMVVGQKGKFVTDGNDMMRRALLLTNSLPDRLQFAIKHNQASSQSSEKGRSSVEVLTPPPVPPRPLPCNRIPSGFELRSSRWHERELPLRSQSRSHNVSRVPPPRPPKSASVIALMMTNPHHVNTNNSVPSRPSRSLLRDRRGDVIEVPQPCRLMRSCPKEKTTCAITMQPSNVSAKAAETERLLPVNMRVNMNPDDEIAEQKRKNKIEAENCELLARNVPLSGSAEEKPCPHCGKNINEVPFQHGRDEMKKPAAVKPDADVERGESLPRCDCSCSSSVEMVTCMWCVKSCFYHCADDAEREENLWADKPCACHGIHCQRRWFYMVFMFFVFPLIILYPLFRLVSDSCCPRPEERKEDRRRQQRSSSNNYTPAPTFS